MTKARREEIAGRRPETGGRIIKLGARQRVAVKSACDQDLPVLQQGGRVIIASSRKSACVAESKGRPSNSWRREQERRRGTGEENKSRQKPYHPTMILAGSPNFAHHAFEAKPATGSRFVLPAGAEIICGHSQGYCPKSGARLRGKIENSTAIS